MPSFPAQTADRAQTERGPTVNDRVWNLVKHLNNVCERCEVVLNRVAPRPSAPSAPGTINRDDNVPPHMLEVVARLEGAVDRVRAIQLELEQIA
jgi:hypothetical protein